MTQKGFTLVELAIALMVIGLLIGGVLKGQELIENAKVTSFMRQIKAYDTAAMIFRNTYGALPGDIKRPTRIPNCTTAICNVAGNGNGKIGYEDTTTNGIEMYNFFPHLTKAGMIQGPEGGDATQMTAAGDPASEEFNLFFPQNALDAADIFSVNSDSADWYDTPFAPRNYYEIGQFTGRVASTIDSKMDDGSPYKGDIRAEDYADCTVDNDPAEEYDTQAGQCRLLIGAGF